MRTMHVKILVVIIGIALASFATLQVSNAPAGAAASPGQAIVADHTIVNMVRLDQVPESAIINAKNALHVAYGHTSHGSQIITGMDDLPSFKESRGGTPGLYSWNTGGTGGALDIDDYFAPGDLGNPDRTTWAQETRDYLNDPAHSSCNVVMWSWCGEVSDATQDDINTYLALMSLLEHDYSSVIFIYMTGHTDGTGLAGNLHIRNNQIRDYCAANGKILFDFEDIESYNPDGTYFGGQNVADSCDYTGGNWAIEWQNAHPGEWYNCDSAHSQPLNANLKAYAAWWMWARLAGWQANNGDYLTVLAVIAGATVTAIAVAAAAIHVRRKRQP